jgi:glycosyltransferase involved in cell wall biosynthesis
MEKNRKRLAIWTHGGIGGGLFGQGFPLIVQIVERLAIHFDVTVYSAASVPDKFEARGYRVCSPSVNLKSSILRWIYLALIFFRHHLKKQFDVTYAFWGYPSGTLIVLLGKILRIPSVVNILGAETADLPAINYGYLRRGSIKRIFWTCNNATKLIAVSGYQVKKLEERGFTKMISVIPWGVDPKQFFYRKKRLELPLKILHVANLNEVKDQETLLRTFKIINLHIKATLRIVGADYLNGKIQRLAREIGLQKDVEFVGAVPHTQIALHYQWADVFMLTSLSEGQNNSITEAMMCGVLPLSTRVGIMYDLGEKVGVVADIKMHEQLGNGLVTLYNDQQEWEKRKSAALKWASSHDLDWTIVELVKVIESV